MRHTLPDQPAISDLILEAQSRLAEGFHPESARRDAESLLLYLVQQHDPDRNRAWLLANWSIVLLDQTQKRFSELVARRVVGEPIQYITGECEFYSLPFHISPDVLIPRPETEHLVEKTLMLADLFPQPRILDVGTGSGIVAVTLARNLSEAAITAIDLSAPALAIAQKNAKHNNVAVRFLHGDLLAPVAKEQFDIVVSNPPYVPESDRPALAIEVRDHEPAIALFAGNDGLDIYRRLIPQAFACLVPGGFIALEIGHGQQSAIDALLSTAGFQSIEFTPDLQSIPRVATAARQ